MVEYCTSAKTTRITCCVNLVGPGNQGFDTDTEHQDQRAPHDYPEFLSVGSSAADIPRSLHR